MNYLITAAGEGSRFIKEGLKPPKPLIKVLGNELLIWSIRSFNLSSSDNLYIVSLKKHNVRERLEKKLNILYPKTTIKWLELAELLNGQMLTAIKAINYFDIKGPLVIHNCDSSYNYDSDEIKNLLKNKLFGIIPCFYAKGSHCSFARSSPEDGSLAIEVKEKLRISDNCSIGTYVFSSCEEFKSMAEEYLRDADIGNLEFYIAPIYQYAIEKNLKVKITKASNVKIFGTPKELIDSFKINFYELIGENGFNGHHRKTLVVDIDKTLCEKGKNDKYSDAKPIKKVCEALRKANSEGVYIILFTSRNMRTFKGSLGLINKITAPIILKWLADNEIPYDEIYFGKPWGNSVSYIDDKNLSIENFIQTNG